MPDNSGQKETQTVAATGGSHPAETGASAVGGSATGGGKAVPDNEVLMGGDSAVGDTGSLDDGALGSGLNSGDSLTDESKATATPKMSPEDGGKSTQDGDAPTGGLGGSSV